MKDRTLLVSVVLMIIFASINYAILREPESKYGENLSSAELKEEIIEKSARTGEKFTKKELMEMHESNDLMTAAVEKYFGKKFPDIDVVNQDDELVSLLEEYSGREVIVAVMGSWCEACAEALPIVSDFNEKQGNVPYVIVGKDDHVANLKEFIGNYSIPYYAAYDFEKFNSQLDVPFVPLIFFLDKNHEIVMLSAGYLDLSYMEYITGRIYDEN